MNMTHPDILHAEIFGMPEPDTVGNCEACHGSMYDYEVTRCKLCDADIHKSCTVKCAHCEQQGCKHCHILDDETGLHFCDTSGTGEINSSECKEEYSKEEQSGI